MNREEAHRALVEWIEAESTLVLATVGADGGPLATPLFYLAEEWHPAAMSPAGAPAGTPDDLEPAAGPAVAPGWVAPVATPGRSTPAATPGRSTPATTPGRSTPAVTPGGDGGHRLPALFWLSSPSSRHSQAVAVSRRAAVSIPGNTRDWSEIRGVQLEGEVALVDDPLERQKQIARYVERFGLDARHEARIAASGLYRFTPRWARYLDNRAGGLGRWEF